MIYLTSILKSIEVYCASTVTTNQLDFIISYTEKIQGTYVSKTVTGTTNSTSPVVMLPSSQGNSIIEISGISIINNDSSPNTITIRLVKTQGGYTTLKQVLLDVGEQMEYDGSQWHVMTSNGEIKTGSGGGGMVYPGVGIAVSTGASWDTSITDNSTNWDAAYSWVNTNGANAVTAYGWGNHASAGYLTGITSLQVTTALGYIPYNATNPSNFITASALSPYLTSVVAASTYQAILVSGTSIKTINSTSILGSGDIVINANSILPTQTSNSGKYLTTDGTNTSWATVSSGGGSLSGLTAATATNTINNANFGQEWQWNSLTSGTGLKLSSTSTSATTGNTLLELNSSGTIGNSVSSYGLKVANSKVSPSGINYGIDIDVGGSPVNIGLNITATSGTARTGINLVAGMVEGIQMNNNTLYFSSTNTQYISHTTGDINFEAGTKQLYFKNTGTTGKWAWFGNTTSYNNYTTLNRHTSNGTMLIFGGEWDGTTTISNTATPSLIKASSGGLTFSSNSGASTTWGSFTPNNQMTIYNVNNNVGIGTTTPVASAILDLTSTTKGFKPPVMTSTQASAISSPAKSLMLYVTDTNGTFTSAGLWIYTTSWKLIIAE